jgi:hypothetical protein
MLSHHFQEITETEFETEIPTHAEDDDLAVEMAALKRSSMLVIRVRFL